MADNLKKLRDDFDKANAAKKGKGIIDVEGMGSKLKDVLSSSPYRRKAPAEVQTVPDMARGTKGLQDTLGTAQAQNSMRLEQERRNKAEPKKDSPKAKDTYKPLKDTSGNYWSPSASTSSDTESSPSSAAKDIDYSGLSRTASDADTARVDLRSSGKADWVDPQVQAQRMMGFKKGGAVKKSSGSCRMSSGGKVSSASKRADGCAVRGKTRGRMV